MTRSRKPAVSIIVPVYNAQDSLENCLECLTAQTYDPEKIQIIAVDNGSTDKSAEICRHFPVTYIYYDKEKGPSAARNAGINKATGEYLIFVDADCLADKNLVAEHIRKHREEEQAGSLVRIIGGAVGGRNRNFWSVCDDLSSWYLFHPRLESRMEKTLLPSGNMSMKKKFLQELGGFNTSLRIGEDQYICQQAKEKGYDLFFLSTAIVFHVNNTTFHGFMKRAKAYADAEAIAMSGMSLVRKKKNIFLAMKNQLFYFCYRFAELCVMVLKTGRIIFLAVLPFIILNKIYFAYHRTKNLLKDRKKSLEN